jgi:hypothetical protein
VVATGTRPTTCSVVGEITSITASPADSTQRPAMNWLRRSNMQLLLDEVPHPTVAAVPGEVNSRVDWLDD